MMQKFFVWYCLSAGLFLSGCSMYQIDVQQGNLVTQEMLDQLQLGMPAKSDGKREQRRISLYFDENKRLQRIEGDVKIGKQRQQKPAPLPDFDQEPIL